MDAQENSRFLQLLLPQIRLCQHLHPHAWALPLRNRAYVSWKGLLSSCQKNNLSQINLYRQFEEIAFLLQRSRYAGELGYPSEIAGDQETKNEGKWGQEEKEQKWRSWKELEKQTGNSIWNCNPPEEAYCICDIVDKELEELRVRN